MFEAAVRCGKQRDLISGGNYQRSVLAPSNQNGKLEMPKSRGRRVCIRCDVKVDLPCRERAPQARIDSVHVIWCVVDNVVESYATGAATEPGTLGLSHAHRSVTDSRLVQWVIPIRPVQIQMYTLVSLSSTTMYFWWWLSWRRCRGAHCTQ